MTIVNFIHLSAIFITDILDMIIVTKLLLYESILVVMFIRVGLVMIWRVMSLIGMIGGMWIVIVWIFMIFYFYLVVLVVIHKAIFHIDLL